MDRITAREMQEFTMHDRGHGLKVAHLMWHIMKSDRRELLSPGDIALLVTSAHLHDLGMGLSQVEREVRLQPDSDLWDNVDPQSVYFKALENLTELARTNQVLKGEAIYQIQQAQEALLCIDTRERHATPARYNEILLSLAAWHEIDPINIPNIDTTLGFDGDSYKEKLVEICVSHNQNAHSLIDRDPSNIDQWRFPIQYPLGCCLVNTRLVAAALRLADILDFDRERTPPVLYHYLLPRSADPSENISVREWSKHLSISNWEIDDYKIIFRGRSPNAVIHHSIVEFCHVIENEIAQTYSVFADEEWPFSIRAKVETMIEAIGYRYVPYRFSLDEERIYELLMGQSIYHNRLDALRELVQNAVDACKLRDAIMLSNDRSIVPSKDHRIVIRYDESKGPEKPAALSVIDTGIGMDQYVIENYFLKVGRSYYKSSDFLRIRSALRRQNLDFNPISEFGIGFMAVFMLGDRVEVETAPWFPARNDAQRRVLKIDGLGRLIELRESQNLSPSHLPGTRVSIRLGSGPNRLDPPTWREVEYYLRQVCRNLDYPILLQQMTSSGNVETQLLPEGLCVPVPQHLANAAFHIEVDNPIEGLKGEIVLFHAGEAGAAEAALAAETPIRPVEQHSYAHRTWRESGVLLRGGFNVGPVPGLPEFVLTPNADARIELTKDPQHPRSLPITDLARSRIVKPNALANSIFKIWCRTLLDSIKDIEARPVGAPDVLTDLFAQARWLEEYNAFEVYRLARTCWRSKFRNPGKAGIAIADWESARGGRYGSTIATPEVFIFKSLS